MAQLPDYTALGERPGPQPAGGIAAYEPPNWRQVGVAGQVINAGGRELEEAANTIAATNDRQDVIVAQSAANSLAQVRTATEFDPNSGFRNVKEGGVVAPDFLKTYTGRLNDATGAIRGSLVNDNQRRIFDQHAQQQSLQFQSALLQHQSIETAKFNDSTANATVSLSLRSMAQRPLDELNFQTNIAQINGTIDQNGARKGLSPQVIAETKSKMLDAAYATRITSVMDGVPGVVDANPYLAEKMFKQVQDQLGPEAQAHLAGKVQKSVQQVQARDIAQVAVFGGAFPAVPNAIWPTLGGRPVPLENARPDDASRAPSALPNAPPGGATKPIPLENAQLQPVIQQMESGGNPNAVSPKGATGLMQVMPETAANPGYGVRPAQTGEDGKPLPGEVDRVGRDYLGAMSARYRDPALVMAAYNAGPAQVDKWLQQFGDPRAGQISVQDWVGKIPFDETKNYVTAGLQKLNTTGHPSFPIAQPTAHQLKTDLFDRARAGRALAEQQYPGDTAYADSVMSRIMNLGNMVIANQQAVQSSAADGLRTAMNGTKPDGSDAPQTIDALLSDPQQKQNWDQATPQVKSMIQREYATGVMQHSDPKLVNDLTRRIYLPDGDPNKLTQPWQIQQYMANGLVHTDQQRLIKEMKDALDPEGSPFVKQVGTIKTAARKMLTGAMTASAIMHPELSEEAAYRFSQDLDAKIAAARKAGTDPQTLFQPGSKDYALDPSRVASFMPSEQAIAARAAGKTVTLDQAIAARGKPDVGVASSVVPKITGQADYDRLAPGTVYVDPNGVRRTKGGQ